MTGPGIYDGLIASVQEGNQSLRQAILDAADVLASKFESPCVTDKNGSQANVVDALDRIADGLFAIAEAVRIAWTRDAGLDVAPVEKKPINQEERDRANFEIFLRETNRANRLEIELGELRRKCGLKPNGEPGLNQSRS